jgi:hypothetical protein
MLQVKGETKTKRQDEKTEIRNRKAEDEERHKRPHIKACTQTKTGISGDRRP